MLKIIIGIIICLSLLFLLTKKTAKNRINKIKEQKTDIDVFKNLISTKQRYPEQVWKLANFYHQGIPDIINSKGCTINGFSPDFKLAIKYYKKLEKTSYSHLSFSRLADIYHYGYVNFENIVDLEKARKYYLKVLFSPYKELRSHAMEKIIQLNRTEQVPSYTSLNNHMNTTYEQGYSLNGNIGNIGNIGNEITITEDIIAEDIITEDIINDSQNVHDPGVVNSVKKEFKELAKIKNIKSNSCDDLINVIESSKSNFSNNSRLHNSRIKKSVDVLNTMVKNNSKISSLDSYESDIIDLVWAKYNEMNCEDKSNFVQNTILQLSEGVEFGKPVCPQGRVERLLTSLKDFEVKPLWALRQEMMNKAPLIRKETLDKYSETEKKWIESPSGDHQESFSDLFEERFKKEMKKIFTKDYVDTGLMEIYSLEQELNSWL